MNLTRRLLTLGIVISLASACGTAEVISTAGSASLHGSQQAMTYSELVAVADAVVIAVAGQPLERGFTENSAIPVAAQSEVGYQGSRYEYVPLRVDQVIAGKLTSAPSVARLTVLVERTGSPAQVQDDELRLEAGKRYLLFLSEGDQLWSGHYLALGVQAVAELVGDQAMFRSGVSAPLDGVVKAVRES